MGCSISPSRNSTGRAGGGVSDLKTFVWHSNSDEPDPGIHTVPCQITPCVFFLRSWVFPRVLNTPHKKLRSIPQGFFPVEEVDIISWETFGSWSLTWSIPGECSMVKCQANQAFFSVESLWFSIMSMFHTQRSVVQFFVFSLGVFIPFVSRRICCELDVLTNALPLKPNIDTQISPYICKGRYQGVTVADCQVHGSHAKIGISPSTVPWRNIV